MIFFCFPKFCFSLSKKLLLFIGQELLTWNLFATIGCKKNYAAPLCAFGCVCFYVVGVVVFAISFPLLNTMILSFPEKKNLMLFSKLMVILYVG